MKQVVLGTMLLAVAVVLSAGSGVAETRGGSVEEVSPGVYRASSGFFSFDVTGTDSLTVSTFGIAAGGEVPAYRTLFDTVTFAAFTRTAPAAVEGEVVSVQGVAASLRVHDAPTAAMEVHTLVQNAVTFRPAPSIGILPRETNALVGDATATGEIILAGDGDFLKAGTELTVTLTANARLFFRQMPLGTELGAHIAAGLVMAEAYISSDAAGARLDVVPYLPAQITLDASSPTRKALTITAETLGPKVLVFNLDRSAFTVPARDLAASLDGDGLSRAASMDDLLASEGAAFVVSESPGLLQVSVLVPEFSTRSLVLQATSPAPLDLTLPLALAGAVAVTVVAAAYLFRPED